VASALHPRTALGDAPVEILPPRTEALSPQLLRTEAGGALRVTPRHTQEISTPCTTTREEKSPGSLLGRGGEVTRYSGEEEKALGTPEQEEEKE